ncbi:saccharopine dehydrogenase [Actinoplanes italicus]|uniref:Saccharopine dehydrogenase-like protein n=1 Tax=Actinoplanes italicus TaxID=113567 RepID=A0A2T0K601_9ACTN|nr:saccharopine dehydrogenase NADP-binding domain-containing protein [Actinoplanes italicus]PRX18384.1 saccharopine dehydrogenase-like protein [Actinoplanes italicus]GIE32793.1 saccharopine dehydrogenase [Actinoplanes italicus]
MNNTVAVFGAYGHTGRFVVAELRRRGLTPIPIGRDAARLAEFGPDHQTRVASAGDPASLDSALKGADAVINTAGPFATTAAPVIEAALRAGIPYVDVAAEIEANADTFTHFSDVDITVLPAMAFFGGLGDLLVTAAMGDWTTADEAHVAYGLSSWQPTAGTLAAGAVSRDRRAGQRVRFTGGRLDYYTDASELPALDWDFPAPMGRRTVLAGFTMADVVTVPSHLVIPEVSTYMTMTAASDLAAGTTDPGGRAAETFTVDVIVRNGTAQRRLTASGRDIYAVSAPLAVEAVQRILDGRTRTTTGVASAGRLFDAPDFLAALSDGLTVA